MTERERLIQLIDKALDKHTSTIENYVHPIQEWIADYLLENGVIVPPCKVGDTVYACKGCFYLPHATKINVNVGIVCEVIAIKETKKGKYLLLKPLIEEAFSMRSANRWFPFSSFGKTVFLTKEAEPQKINHNSLCETDTYKVD